MQNMLGKLPLSEIQGPRDDFEQKLAGSDGEQWLAEFKNFLRKEKTWVSSLLKQVATVEVTGAAKFVAADHFKVGTTDDVKIAWLSDNFKQFFLGKTEEGVGAVSLNVYELVKNSLDVAPILAELGPGERAETSLAHFWALFTKQPNGESGPLLTNGYANIFYVCGTDGNLWAVSARWYSGGWCVDASSVVRLYGWSAGYRFFSR